METTMTIETRMPAADRAERELDAITSHELNDEELSKAAGGLHFWKAIFIGGTSANPGGTGTDTGPTKTNAQAWVVSVS
jgi:hypothetical protein